MDPTQCLKEILDLINESKDWSLDGTYRKEEICDEIACKVEKLNEWLSKGGFLPDQWNTNERSRMNEYEVYRIGDDQYRLRKRMGLEYWDIVGVFLSREEALEEALRLERSKEGEE